MIDLAGLRIQVETDLPDASLQLVLSAVDEELTSKYGAATSATEVIFGEYRRYLFLCRLALTLTSATERESDGTTTVLDVSGLSTADVRMTNGRMLERLVTGTHPRDSWAPETTVVYAPNDVNRRDLAIVQLVKLELEYNGKRSESVGDYSMSSAGYAEEKARIIGGLRQWGLA
jgi:hypothetical protein